MVDFGIHSENLGPMGFTEYHLHDRGADSYHRFREDVESAAKLKVSTVCSTPLGTMGRKHHHRCLIKN